MTDTRFDLSDAHFGRFRRPAEAGAAAVSEARERLSCVVSAGAGLSDVVEAAVDLAEALTVAGHEHEAVELVGPAVRVAREAASPETLGWALLTLATAQHYAADPAAAERHFLEALGNARDRSDEQLEHYVLHHLGRFLVDTGRPADAQECFEAALAIRERLCEPRAAGTRDALAALAARRT